MERLIATKETRVHVALFKVNSSKEDNFINMINEQQIPLNDSKCELKVSAGKLVLYGESPGKATAVAPVSHVDLTVTDIEKRSRYNILMVQCEFLTGIFMMVSLDFDDKKEECIKWHRALCAMCGKGYHPDVEEATKKGKFNTVKEKENKVYSFNKDRSKSTYADTFESTPISGKKTNRTICIVGGEIMNFEPKTKYSALQSNRREGPNNHGAPGGFQIENEKHAESHLPNGIDKETATYDKEHEVGNEDEVLQEFDTVVEQAEQREDGEEEIDVDLVGDENKGGILREGNAAKERGDIEGEREGEEKEGDRKGGKKTGRECAQSLGLQERIREERRDGDIDVSQLASASKSKHELDNDDIGINKRLSFISRSDSFSSSCSSSSVCSRPTSLISNIE